MISEFAQPDTIDYMIGALVQDKVGALARGQNIFAQVDEIDGLPDAGGSFLRLGV